MPLIVCINNPGHPNYQQFLDARVLYKSPGGTVKVHIDAQEADHDGRMTTSQNSKASHLVFTWMYALDKECITQAEYDNMSGHIQMMALYLGEMDDAIGDAFEDYYNLLAILNQNCILAADWVTLVSLSQAVVLHVAEIDAAQRNWETARGQYNDDGDLLWNANWECITAEDEGDPE